MKTATIILAAGKGTRMKSEEPKVVFEIAGKPMIKRVIETAREINSEKIIVVVGYKREVVKNVIGKQDDIDFAVQEPQNGTGHAVMVCQPYLEDFRGTVFVLYGDVPLLRSSTLKKMYELHLKKKAACTVLTAVLDDPLQYGRIIRDENEQFRRIVEFKDASAAEKEVKEINTGIYCFDSYLLQKSLSCLTNDNKQGEYYLTDTLEILKEEGHPIACFILQDMAEASGVNSIEQLKNLESLINENDC